MSSAAVPPSLFYSAVAVLFLYRRMMTATIFYMREDDDDIHENERQTLCVDVDVCLVRGEDDDEDYSIMLRDG
jgi:hypothetical protein